MSRTEQPPTGVDDTDPEAAAFRARLFAAMPPAEKLELVADAIRTSRTLLWAGLCHRFPAESEARRERRLLGLVVGEELATTIWGPLDAAR